MQDVCLAQSNRKPALVWATLAFFAGFAAVSAFGPIVTKLKDPMALSPVFMGLLSASPALTGSLLRIPFGALVDRMGGKIPILVLLGLSSMGIAGTTLTFAFHPQPQFHHFYLFLASGVLSGCGIAVFSVGVPTVSYWYPQQKQGTALALYGGLGNLAPGVFAFVLPILVLELGFFSSYMIWFVMLLLVMVLFLFFMRDAPYFQYKEMGIKIDKEALLHACGEELVPTGTMMTSIRKAGADYRTWVLTGLYFVSFGGFIALTAWLPTYWREYYGVSFVMAGVLTLFYSLGTSLLRIFGGFVSDRFDAVRLIAGSFLLVFFGSIAMMLPYKVMGIALGGIFLLALGMGFANAATFKLVPKFMPSTVGGVAGIVGGLGALGGFVIPILMGLFVRFFANSGYSLGFSIFVLGSIVSLLLLARLRRSSKKGNSVVADGAMPSEDERPSKKIE
jgi:MFS transporter, NNP family, nitrate/nitrite transporter